MNTPLSKAQLALYEECVVNSEGTIYNIPLFTKLGDDLEIGKLKRSLVKMFSFHPYLNVRLSADADGRISQRIDESAEIRIGVHRVREDAIESIKSSAVRPFKLLDSPLYRIEFFITPESSYLFTDFHHLIFDDSSYKVFINDLNAIYNGRSVEKEKISGIDLALEEEKEMHGEKLAAAKSYYASLLDGMARDCTPYRDAYGDEPAETSYKIPLPIDKQKYDKMRAMHGVTEAAFFTAAAGYLIGEYNALGESIIDTVYDGRKDERCKNTIGLLIKAFPFCTKANSDSTVEDFLISSTKQIEKSTENYIYPFSDMEKDLDLKNNINFAYRPDLADLPDLSEKSETEILIGRDNVFLTPLCFNVITDKKNGEDYSILINYRSDKYSLAFISGLAESYIQLVNELLSKKYLREVSVTSPKQIEEINAFNATECPFDTHETVVDMFRESAAKYPDNAAYIYNDYTITYSKLDKLTENLAQYVASLGIGKEDVVSLLIGRNENMVICPMGVMKAGAAYQPLDPSYPMERLEFMINDASAKLVIADESLLKLIPHYSGKILLTKDIPSLKDKGIKLTPPSGEDLFILLYTSGSTGNPKGCMIEHHSIASLARECHKLYNLTEKDRVSAYISFGFSLELVDLYPALTRGSAVVMVGNDIRLDLAEIDKYFAKTGVTHANLSTQFGRQLALSKEKCTVKYIVSGGEKLVPFEPEENMSFCNVYGSTECTGPFTMFKVDKKYKDIPVGSANGNMKLYVVNARGQMLPVGAAGELWASGYQVSRGYLNRPEQTEKAFTKNPFSTEKGYETVYHMGDIVRMLPDGNIQFIGRCDSQVKVRGFRIELSEVEEVIRKFDGVADATVAAFDEPDGSSKFLAAYIVSDEKIDIEALNRFILGIKPPYMVPAITMQIDEIPVNQNQKVNKKALPVPERKVENAIPPKTELQKQIFDIIADIIGTKAFGINTDIYTAGLTSISSVKLNVKLDKTFNAVIRIKDLQENNTVEKLEKFIQDNKNTKTVFERLEDYPVTQTQMGIFIESIAHPDTTIYNVPILLRLFDGVDCNKLENAVYKAVEAHSYFKTRLFMDENSDLRQRRLDDAAFSIEVLHIKNISDIESDIMKPFDLLQDRLIRIKIIKAESVYLFIETHHIISDGSSLNIFIRDIANAYDGEEPHAEEYTSFEAALDEEHMRVTDEYEKAKAYYGSLLSGVETECLPEKDAPKGASGAGFREISDDIADKAQQYCKANSLTMNALFMSAFGYLIGKFINKEESVFTTIYNGRSDSRTENSVGMFVKTLPLYCRADSDKKIKDYCKEVGAQYNESMANDLYSFGEVSREYGIKSDIMFAYQGDNFEFNSFSGKKIDYINLNSDESKAPLNLNVNIADGKMQYIIEYRQDMYSDVTAENLLKYYKQIVSEFISKSFIKDVEPASEEDLKIIEGFNDTKESVENVTTVALFERQVKVHPDRKACICKGESLTYSALNENANKVAHTLISAGVKPDDMVGVMIPRYLYSYAVREGILKSGAAMMPVAPDYPDDRVSYIFENSHSSRIVTTAEIAKRREKLFKDYNIEVFITEDIFKMDKTDNPVTALKPENLCYCIYTSGSTGKPKGVMIEHHSLVNFVAYNKSNWQSAEYVENMTVSLALAAFTFDVSVLEESLPLYHGATIALATDDEIHDPFALADMLIENHVDVMKCTPSFMLSMIDEERVQTALRKLKAIDIGAESFPAQLYDKMRAVGITAKIHNGYGPTETTITASLDRVENNKITIGKPLCNTEIYMLDKNDRIMPVGMPGELTICGDCVGRGYIGLPDMNKEKFIEYRGMRAYRSGDVAKWLPNGKIGFLGRSDNQVKLRGLRVELDEIENVMNTYPSVKRSIVLVKENDSGQFLCGYFTASENIDTADLAAHLQKSLTEYMVPGVFVQLKEFPMNNNGKVDKKALPEPEFSAVKLGGKKAENDLEKQLCEIFEKATGVANIGIDDDFFKIGGTSLSVSKVAMKCMIAGIPVVYGNVFDYPTVEKLEQFINSQNGVSTPETAEKAPEAPQPEEPQLSEGNDVLKYNTPEYVDEIVATDIGNVLLTGSTGFLGMHVLKNLVDNCCKKIFCIVRPKGSLSAQQHLQSMLMYYFDDTFDEMMGSRITVISGDITDKDMLETLGIYDFDTAINCAACVKHFSNSDLLERVNVQGVKNLISVCKSLGKKLVQVSTVSIAGESLEGEIPRDKKIHENELYFGQRLENKYIDTKFRAEEAVLDAVADGMRGKIIRVGNLMSRYADGEFQINFVTNGFMKRLRAYAVLGEFSVGEMDSETEFSPIDYTAAAIVKLASTPDKFTVFHAYNSHFVHMANIIEEMNECGININVVSQPEFDAKFNAMLADDNNNMKISSLISYASNQHGKFFVDSDNSFTTKALYRLGFSWPLSSEEYMRKAIMALSTLGFFEKD